jgi:hypothetical protein
LGFGRDRLRQLAEKGLSIAYPGISGSSDGPGHLNKAAIQSAYYSAATLIVNTAAEELQIDPREIQIASVRPSYRSAEIILCDELVNGSGYVEWLERNMANVLANGVGRRCDCETSCFKCLQYYGNRHLHAILDLELGVDLLRLAKGDKLDDLLGNWQEKARKIAEAFVKEAFRKSTEISIGQGGWPMFEHNGQKFLVTHPFVQRVHGNEARIISTFNAKRRPGWCVLNKGKMPLNPGGEGSAQVDGIKIEVVGLPQSREIRVCPLGAAEEFPQRSVEYLVNHDGKVYLSRAEKTNAYGSGNTAQGDMITFYPSTEILYLEFHYELSQARAQIIGRANREGW